MKTPLCGMLTLAAIYFTAQTTTPPTGKVGINTTEPTETLDVKGKVRIQGLYSENDQTGTKLSETDDNKTFTATDVVTANANGVLGKKSLSSIIAAQTPNFPWKKVGTTENAVPAGGLSMYSKYKTGIGDYSKANSSISGALEVLDGPEDQFTLRRGDYRWNFNAYTVNNNPFLTIVGRPNNKRLLSLSSLGALYLGSGMTDSAGSGANLILDGGTGTIGIGKNSTDYDLDVNGYTRISQLPTSNDYAKYYTTENGTRVQKTKTDKYVPAKMVVVDADGVLGKQDLPTIPTIPTEPWNKLGGTTQATANTDNIYQKGKVGIGDYTNISTFNSDFEVNSSRNGYHVGIANGADTKWNLSAENDNEKPFTITRRHSSNNGGEGRVLSLTKDTKLYLGSDIDTNGTRAKILVDGKDGKVAIGKNSADYKLDVAGDAKISGLKDGNGYTATHMVVADANGVLGKQDFPTIPTMPTIPTEPWRQLGGTDEATTNTQNIYQNGKVGIGNYASTSTFDSDFEVNSNRNGYHVGIANGADTKWNLSAESGNEKAFTITKRHPNNQGRLLSLDKDAKLYLGNTLLNTSGSGAKILVDGGQGKVAIGKNSADYNLDVKGNAKISGLPEKSASDTVKMVVVDNSGVLKKADIPTGGGSGNGVTNHTGSNDAVQCNAANAGTIHYKEGVTVNGQPTSVMGFCMKTASTSNKYRWFYIFGGAGTTTGSEADAPNFGDGL